jgi:hypothetical protein
MRRKRASRNVIALLTDFGENDHYAGTMKGVILSINSRATIVDISHHVSPYNVRQAGYLLWASYRSFPDGTIFVCVVDPGVGGKRKIVGVETDRFVFVAPDNGLLDMVRAQEDIHQSYEIVSAPRIDARSISTTFHGRDVFAPLAAALSQGKSVKQFGRLYKMNKAAPIFYERGKENAEARILHIDRFGNLVTNIPAKYFDRCAVRIGRSTITTFIRNYDEAPRNTPCIIVGSSGLFEIVLREGSAAERFGVSLQEPNVLAVVG